MSDRAPRRRILVTGGAGFIGASLVRRLVAENHRVSVLDDFSTGQHRHLEGLDLELHKGDIRDHDLVAKVVPGHNAVIHLAAQSGVVTSIRDPMHDCTVNVMGTLNLLDRARIAGVQRFVFASSNACLGRQNPPASEDKAPLPLSPYGSSKVAAEAYCLSYWGTWRLPTVALRFGNVYGPFSEEKSSVVAKFFKDITEIGRITVEGDGCQTRDFVYVEDICDALLAALASDLGGEVFQIATGVETSINDLVTIIRDIVGRPIEINNAPARQGDARKNYSNIIKAKRLLNWEPRTDLREGLRKTWSWFHAA